MKGVLHRVRGRVILIATLAVTVTALAIAPASQAAYPKKVAALGDSITQAATTCLLQLSCPANSWATGSNSQVNSILRRLKAINPLATGTNHSVSGARVADLIGQANGAISAKPQLVSVMIGANDACGATGVPTAPADFANTFQQLVNKLKAGLPNSKIVVASLPNLYYLYTLFKNDPIAVVTWNIARFCPQMTSAPDEATRQATLQRVIAFNSSMATICAGYANCIWDNLKMFNYQFKKSDIGTTDYFHPSIAGQATIAREAWSLVPNTF